MELNLSLGLNHWSFSWLECSVKSMSFTILNSKFTYSNHLNSSHLNSITLRHGWDWWNIWTWLRTRVFRSVFNAVYTLLVLKCYIYKIVFLGKFKKVANMSDEDPDLSIKISIWEKKPDHFGKLKSQWLHNRKTWKRSTLWFRYFLTFLPSR